MSNSAIVELVKRTVNDATSYSRSRDVIPAKDSDLVKRVKETYPKLRDAVDIKGHAVEMVDPASIVQDDRVYVVSHEIQTWLPIVLRQVEPIPGEKPISDALPSIHVDVSQAIKISESQESLDKDLDFPIGSLSLSSIEGGAAALATLPQGPTQWCNDVDVVLDPLQSEKNQPAASKKVDIASVTKALDEFANFQQLQTWNNKTWPHLEQPGERWRRVDAKARAAAETARNILFLVGTITGLPDAPGRRRAEQDWWITEQLQSEHSWLNAGAHFYIAANGLPMPAVAEDFFNGVYQRRYINFVEFKVPTSFDITFDDEKVPEWKPTQPPPGDFFSPPPMMGYRPDYNHAIYVYWVGYLKACLDYLYPRWAALEPYNNVRQLQPSIRGTTEVLTSIRKVVNVVHADTREDGVLSRLKNGCRIALDDIVGNACVGALEELAHDVDALKARLNNILSWYKARKDLAAALESAGYQALDSFKAKEGIL